MLGSGACGTRRPVPSQSDVQCWHPALRVPRLPVLPAAVLGEPEDGEDGPGSGVSYPLTSLNHLPSFEIGARAHCPPNRQLFR